MLQNKKFIKFQLHYANFLIKNLPILNIKISEKELILTIPFQFLKQIIFFLKYNNFSQFKVLSDICAIDFLSLKNRFAIVYNLLSIKYNVRLRLITYINEVTAIDSITSIYPCANWFEREVWDMFGILFTNHPDLRRILTDYGFEGHPLRKDFPVSGYIEFRYCEIEKRLIGEPLELSQQFKNTNFKSPWNY